MKIAHKFFHIFNNKKIKITALCIFILLYTIYAFLLLLRPSFDSDYANLVLEAKDITHGNPFLTNWNLTGITFITTDLLYFIFGVLLQGASYNAYSIAVTLMFVSLFISSLFLLKANDKKMTLFDFLIFFSIAGIPCLFYADMIRAHTAVIVYVFISLFFVQQILQKKEKKHSDTLYYILLTVFIGLGSMGDPLMAVLGVLPICAVLGYHLLGNGVTQKKQSYRLIGFSILGLGIGQAGSLLFESLGNVNKNQYVELKSFIAIDQLPDKFYMYVQGVLKLFNADFTSGSLSKLSTFAHFVPLVVVLFGFYVIFKNIKDFFQRKNSDYISVILSVGFVLVSCIFIFTTIAVSINSSRYIAYTPALFAILIVRYFKNHTILDKKFFENRLKLKTIAVLFSVVLLITAYVPLNLTRENTSYDRLGVFLQQQGLKNGYASFWNASHVTVATKENVNLRAVTSDGKEVSKFNWFCKDTWYAPQYSNFFVIEKTDSAPEFGINEKNVIALLGMPAKILDIENYEILVYDKDITEAIRK